MNIKSRTTHEDVIICELAKDLLGQANISLCLEFSNGHIVDMVKVHDRMYVNMPKVNASDAVITYDKNGLDLFLSTIANAKSDFEAEAIYAKLTRKE